MVMEDIEEMENFINNTMLNIKNNDNKKNTMIYHDELIDTNFFSFYFLTFYQIK